MSLYPFPADVDAANLASGVENAWKLLGATVGMLVGWWLDVRFIHFDTRAVWYVQLIKLVGGLALLYILAALPMWFKRPDPVIFVPVDFAAIALFLLYVNYATGGHWYLSFALPVTGAAALLVCAMVTLLKYLPGAALYICGGALILSGGLAVLVEFLLNLTFGLHDKFLWSIYPLAVGVVLGAMLLVIAVSKPLRRSLHRKFFL